MFSLGYISLFFSFPPSHFLSTHFPNKFVLLQRKKSEREKEIPDYLTHLWYKERQNKRINRPLTIELRLPSTGDEGEKEED